MKLVVANHKMNLTKEEVLAYVNSVKDFSSNTIEFVFCPSNLYLPYFSSLPLGSQDVSSLKEGSLTGDVSAKQLKSMGVSYTIVGHSERRVKLQEDADMIQKKIENLLEEGIIPILCIGESSEEKEQGKVEEVLDRELAILSSFSKEEIASIVIAYEPMWAIGTGVLPSNQEIENRIHYIKEKVYSLYQVPIKVLYGGSVNIDNIDTLEMIPNMDGYLVGGASLDGPRFLSLMERMR